MASISDGRAPDDDTTVPDAVDDESLPTVVHDGAAVLDDVDRFIRRYVAFPSVHDATAVTLWAAHTFAVGRFYISPRLLLDSAEPGSGKTRVLELLHLLCANAKMSVSTTPAAIFRRLDQQMMTLLMDEIDNVFNPKASGNSLDLLALLNAGYKRGATVDRCVGDAKAMTVKEFKVFAPVALAGISGHMPRALVTRSVVVHMRRRSSDEEVEPFYEEDAIGEAAPLRVALAEWMASVADEFRAARPTLPDGVVDRPAELWRTLLAVADAASGAWPDKAREACRHHVLDSANVNNESTGIRLLTDLRTVFGDRTAMHTASIITALIKLDDAPWSGVRGGSPIDPKRLAAELDPYGIKSKDVREKEKVAKGYSVDGPLADAWRRYVT